MADLRSVAEHQDQILDSLRPLAAVRPAAPGRPRPGRRRGRLRADRAAELRQLGDGRLRRGAATTSPPRPTRARCTCPSWGRSAPARRRILALSPGTAVKIMTGAPVPAGADAVVPYEWTDRGVAQVVISKAPEPGQHVRSAGEDVAEGDLLIEEGTLLGPRQLGLLASVGRASVSSGPGRAWSSCRPARSCASPAPPAATTRSTTATPTCSPRPYAARARSPTASGIVPDEPQAFLDALGDQLVRADVVITTAGVSMGDYDVVKEALTPLGHRVVRRGCHAAGQAPGFRCGGRGRDPDLHAAGQPGLLVRLLRDVRAAGAAPDDGPPAVRAADRRGDAHPRRDLACRPRAVPPRRARLRRRARHRRPRSAGPARTWSATWPRPTR